MPSFCLIVAVLLILPAAAVGGSSESIVLGGPRPQAVFSLKGSNGYSIAVEGRGREISLSVFHFRGEFAEYRVQGKASAREVRARFGKYGKVSVEFRPSGSIFRKVPPGNCKGDPKITRFGVFAGTIRFSGEYGYTKVHETRAKGHIRSAPRWKCKPRPGAGKPQPFPNGSSDPDEVTTLLDVRARKGKLFFGASSYRSAEFDSTSFFAAKDEQRGRVRILRFAITHGPEQAFTFDEGLTTATVDPPKPFSGTGLFLRNSNGSTRWSGSLAVSLPGTKDIALTGSGYKARLIQPETMTQVLVRTQTALARRH